MDIKQITNIKIRIIKTPVKNVMMFSVIFVKQYFAFVFIFI